MHWFQLHIVPFCPGAGTWDHRFVVNKKKCQEKCSQLRSFNTIKTFTLAHRDGDAELADTPGFKGGRGAAVKELTLQRGLFIGTKRCPPPAQRPTESNSFCSNHELWETGEPMGGLQCPSRDLTFLSDSLMNSGMRSWPFEEVITLLVKKKIAPDCAVHVYTMPKRQTGVPWDGCHNRETHFRELFIHRRSWKDVCWIMQKSGSSWNPGCHDFK